jgi:hypothetical protein
MFSVSLFVRLFHGANKRLLWQDCYRNYDDNTGGPLSRKSKLDLYYSRSSSVNTLLLLSLLLFL